MLRRRSAPHTSPSNPINSTSSTAGPPRRPALSQIPYREALLPPSSRAGTRPTARRRDPPCSRLDAGGIEPDAAPCQNELLLVCFAAAAASDDRADNIQAGMVSAFRAVQMVEGAIASPARRAICLNGARRPRSGPGAGQPSGQRHKYEPVRGPAVGQPHRLTGHGLRAELLPERGEPRRVGLPGHLRRADPREAAQGRSPGGHRLPGARPAAHRLPVSLRAAAEQAPSGRTDRQGMLNP
jgi:hypothetical protein